MRGGWPFWLLILTVGSVAAIAFAGSQGSTVLKSPGVAVLAPVETALRAASDAVMNVAQTAISLGAMAEENQRLRQQVDQLQSEIVRLNEAGEENRELRDLLQFERDNPGREYQPASALGTDPSKLVRSLLVNRGSRDGVQRGMVVVTYLGLVGKVSEVFPNAARILLLTDASSVVNAVDQRSRVEGVVAGRGENRLSMQFVQKSADVQEGDLIVSSGLGGGFPKGIIIGRVERVTSNDQDLFKTIQVEPAVNPDVVGTVLFVKDFVPTELPRR
jgi:rod shape-determining protein MreC